MKFKGDAFYCCEVTLYIQTKLLHIESFLLHLVISQENAARDTQTTEIRVAQIRR